MRRPPRHASRTDCRHVVPFGHGGCNSDQLSSAQLAQRYFAAPSCCASRRTSDSSIHIPACLPACLQPAGCTPQWSKPCFSFTTAAAHPSPQSAL